MSCQTDCIQMNRSKSVQQQNQDIMDCILPVTSLLFSGKQFKVYGTNEEPLFKCSDILIRLLGYQKSNKNWFYMTNKSNLKYVFTVVNQDPIKNQRFFTELGLYKCLFTSQKPQALEFQEEVFMLLKNIRLGVVGLYIAQIEELQTQLKDTTQLSALRQHCIETISQQQSTIKITNQRTGRSLICCTIDPKRYISQQRNKSHNSELRSSIEHGDPISVKILRKDDIYTTADRGTIKRQELEKIDNKQLMNKRFPNPEAERVVYDRVPEDHTDAMSTIEESKTEATHQAITLLDQKPKLLINALKQVDDIKQYLDTHNGVYPKKRSLDPVEKELAVAIERIRKEYNGKIQSAVTNERQEYIKKVIPNFKYEGIDIKFENSVNTLKQFYDTHKRIPQYGGSQASEKTIYGIMQRIKQAAKENDTKYLTEERFELVKRKLPFLDLIDNTLRSLAVFKEKLLQLKSFYDANQRLPLRNSEQERVLHTLYYTLRDQLADDQKREIALDIFPRICTSSRI